MPDTQRSGLMGRKHAQRVNTAPYRRFQSRSVTFIERLLGVGGWSW